MEKLMGLLCVLLIGGLIFTLGEEVINTEISRQQSLQALEEIANSSDIKTSTVSYTSSEDNFIGKLTVSGKYVYLSKESNNQETETTSTLFKIDNPKQSDFTTIISEKAVKVKSIKVYNVEKLCIFIYTIYNIGENYWFMNENADEKKDISNISEIYDNVDFIFVESK